MSFDKNDIYINDTYQLFINKFSNSNTNLPELIYWNLNEFYNNLPINNDYYNISIISGFSHPLLSLILSQSKITPETLMNKILEPYYTNIII